MTKAFLVLTSPPGHAVLSDSVLARLAAALPELPAAKALVTHEAVEFALPDYKDIIDKTAAALAGLPVDINLVPAENRRKAMLVADLESTIIEQECLDELAVNIGRQAEMEDITARAMRGELDFEPALRERVAMLTGLPEADLQRLYDEVITLMPGAQTLLAGLKRAGLTCGLVSGGFTFFAGRIAERLHFDRFRANHLLLDKGMVTGKVAEPILGRAAKAEIMAEWCDELGLQAENVLAVGDGSNDLAMLQAAGMGVAFRAKPLVAEAARYRIDHGDLTALLHLQGLAA
ncbi:MAG: phosphoserine phosphatase SerB [Parvibaculales bacterium]